MNFLFWFIGYLFDVILIHNAMYCLATYVVMTLNTWQLYNDTIK